MKCSKCDQEPEFYCHCQKLYFCQHHINLHLVEPGNHLRENLNLILNEVEFIALKTSATKRMYEIEIKKNLILTLSKNLIKEIESYTKVAVDELNSLSLNYLRFISFKKLSKSLKDEAQKILTTEMKIKVVSVNISPILKEAFNKNLVVFIDKLQMVNNRGDENECKRREAEENKRIEGLEIKILDKEKKEPEISSRVFNSWKLEEKQDFMESLNISDYQDWLARDGNSKLPISEIKFSNDSKLSFICKNYSGIFK